MWPHKKFFSSKIKSTKKSLPKTKAVPTLLKKTLKAKPKKRQKRGILKSKETGKKAVEIVDVKPRKRVSFGKQMIGKRIEQEEQLYRKGWVGQYSNLEAGPDPQTLTAADKRRRFHGSRGDQRASLFRMDNAGRLKAIAAPRRRIIMG